MKLYLQNIVSSIQFNTLPAEWVNFDFVKFSNKKSLFDYQKQALESAIKAIYKYYVDCNQDKTLFFEIYKNNGFVENLDLKIVQNKKYKIFQEFDSDYKIEDGKIAFHHFINRMSFWMATGSGKTLVIVKLLELLGNLIKNNLIPANDILFLTHREDLIEQFKNHIYEFNASNSFNINLFDLKDYEKIKRENKLNWQNYLDVFYYRSDLISDEQKEKIIDFRNYDNNGKWYILLDEAHKGDKEDSKRQFYYSILSRNGFLFNFSATFTDPIDFVTCVFNFNLERFIQEGYGKHIYISKSNIGAISDKNDYTESQKKLIITKILLLHTLISKLKLSLKNYYHKPLILTLVNSVNTEDSDLELFFKQIEYFAENGIDEEIFNNAKEELVKDFQGNCEFDNEAIDSIELIHTIVPEDILQYVFNSKTKGKIEVLKIPNNKQELVFKFTTSDKPFALIKIGDITEWIKNKLSGYEIVEKYDNESVFRKINSDDSDINILMGSRAFYEGWDSTRPNIILYINIGKGTDAKKFILQSIGRGVRIEPVHNKRKRLQFLLNNNEIEKEVYSEIKDNIKLIETLFVYGTKAENLKEVIETLKEEKQEEIIGDLFEINPEVKDKLLLIPTYKDSERILLDENFIIKFEINEKDFELVKDYFNYINDKVLLVKYDCQPKIIQKFKESFENRDLFYLTNLSISVISKPDILIKKIMNHFSLKSKELMKFKPVDNEIIHFKQIKITEKQREKIEQKIKQVLSYKEKDKKLAEITEKLQKEPQKAIEYIKEIETITLNYVKENEVEYDSSKIKLKYLPNHYYLPVAMSESEKETYLLHIIKNKSEVNFVNELEKYLQKDDNYFKKFDWWFFSKIDETLDEVYIPYYQPKTNRIEKFKPDFIFWLKKDNDYTILFIDPKGTEHTDGYRKIDGFSRIFEEENNGTTKCKTFLYNEFKVTVKLLLFTNKKQDVIERYKNYWFDNFYNLLVNV